MSKKIKDEQKKFLGETLNQYDKALDEAINQLDKKNREQNHKISSLVNSFDNEYLEKDVEGNMTTLENSKDGMVIINEIQGNTEVNYCKDGEKELILNGDIDTQGESFVTITESVDGGLVDVSLEGNTEINLSKTKDPVLVTREFDDINCNVGKLQYTIDDVTTINDEPGKVDIDRIVGDTMVNHAVNGSEELVLNAHINESGDNNITLNGVTSDGGKVDVTLEGNTLVNVSNVKDDYITPTIEDKVDQGSVISLPEVSEGLIHIDEIEGNTLVNYCTDGSKEMTLNGDIDVEGTFVTTTEGVDNGKIDVMCEGNTLVNLSGDWIKDENFTIDDNNYATVQRVDTTNIWVRHKLIQPLKDATTYTIIVNIKENTFSTTSTNEEFILANGYTIGIKVSIPYNSKGIIKKKFITSQSTASGWHSQSIETVFYNANYTGKIVFGDFILLEGDWTDREVPQHFIGMQSVGQDDTNGHKIEILSQNKNLLPLSHVSTDSEGYGNRQSSNWDNVRLKPNTKYTLSYTGKATNYTNNYMWGIWIREQKTGKAITDNHIIKSEVTDISLSFTTTNEEYYKIQLVPNNGDNTGSYLFKPNTVILEEGEKTSYVPYALNKKEILINEPLRGLPNGIKDRKIKIGGKWYIERNCRMLSINGSESGWNASWTTDFPFEGTSVFSATLLSHHIHSNSSICDKYRNVSLDGGEVGLITARGGEGTIGFRVKNTTASTVEEWKNYLNTNEIKIVYALTTPIYEPLETEPVLNTYNDITHISNNSIIPCNMKIKNTGYNAIIKPSTLYTVALDTNESGTVGMNLGGMKTVTTNNVVTITTPAILSDDSLRLFGKGIKGSKVRLLEGDKTNWIPSFFEGMKSSFEDKVQDDGSYKMEILSNNKNLINVPNMKCMPSNNGGWWNLEGTTNSMYDHINKKTNLYFYAEKGKRYIISFDSKNLALTQRLKYQEQEMMLPLSTISNENGRYKLLVIGDGLFSTFRFRAKIEDGFTPMEITNFMITEESSYSGEFIENKSNSIQLSSIEPLRGVNEIHDRLVFKDGKLMIERNIGEVTIKDNISYVEVVNSSSSTNRIYTTRFILGKDMFPNIKLKTDYYFKSDRFKHVLWNLDVEGFSIGSNLDFNILSIRLSSLDDKGVKEWFRNNPTKFAYLLAEPTYEEIPYNLQKIILESYANGTLFFDTNIPPTKVSFNCFEEELTYLYPSTSYTVQFNSDRTTTADVNLGGTELLAQNVVKGLNKITITTPTTLTDNKLIINGAGAKISDVVVTDTNREFKYFEGMKSVGENGLKIYSGKPQRFGKGGRI